MVRLALIGCNTASDYVAVLPRVMNAEIVATVDDDGDKARWAAETLSVQSLASIDKVLSADHIDSTLIHFSDGASVGRKVVKAGKHVFVEGIPGLSVAQMDEVISASEAAGVKLMVGLATRYLPSQQTVKNAIASGDLGGVGNKPMGELEIEGIYPLAHVLMLTGAKVRKVFARTASHFHQ